MTFNLISSYLKKDGILIFSWDHPFMHCIDAVDEQLVFSGRYYEKEPFTFKKDIGKSANRSNFNHDKESGYSLTLYNRRLSDYISALSKAGLMVEQLVEETDKETLSRDCEFSSTYYSEWKAKKLPLSFIIKARKV
ncbi:hypothetical protein SDC9_186971 [bioreactor metagenome]|uniref:Methyltransferase type 11 domain-containing protein n=1 Tax=bioreactor metagenome TaxID=1076179 RepID=A0A645HVQ9_9ZZZZ